MKKFTTLVLCFVLTASVLTACRSKAPEETNSPTNSANDTTPTVMPKDMMPDMDRNGGNDNARGSRRNIPFD